MKIKLEKKLLKSLALMAAVVEARDAYTGGHLWRVANISALIAEKLGLSSAQAYHVSLGGFLHDLGKVGVPDAILTKQDRLTEEEYAVVKTHPAIGDTLIKAHPLGMLAAAVVRHHHEWIDGSGYPDGLVGEHIPLYARIVSMADAFDAMTSTRPYRVGMNVDKALADLEIERGTQFEDTILDALKALALLGSLDGIVGHSDVDTPLVVCPNCGPVLPVPRDAEDGDLIYCRICKGEMRLEKYGGTFVAGPTGRTASADQLRPGADLASLEAFVNRAPAELSIQE